MDKKIKELALQKAFEHFFSNVGEEDWPKNPDVLLESHDDGILAIELFPEMEVWEPFESYSVGELKQLMSDFQKLLLDFYQGALIASNDLSGLHVLCKKSYVECDIQYWTAGCVYDATDLGDGEYSIATDLGSTGHVGPAYLLNNFDDYFEVCD